MTLTLRADKGSPLTNGELDANFNHVAQGLLGMRNKIINGNFRINQRGAGSTSAARAAGAYVNDRWKAGAGGCTMSFAFDANGLDFVVTITAGSLVQVVEPAHIEGGVFALSHEGTAQARIGINGAAPAGAYAAATKAAPLVSPSASAGQSITIEFGTGTISRVQLEPGAVATPFERRLEALELVLCQRYFELGLNTSIIFGYTAAGNSIFVTYGFKANKRGTPTITATTVGNNNMTVGSLGVSAVDAVAVRFVATVSAAGAGYFIFTWTADAEL